MIAPYRISWNGYSSRDFDVLTELAFDGDSGETNTFLNRQAVVSETYDGSLKRGHTYKWNEALAPKITFIKEDFGDFSQSENRKMLTWLTGKKTAGFLSIYHDDSEVISYEILGNWTEIQQYKLGNGRIVGYTAVFESLTPYAFSALQTVTKDVSDPSDNTFPINLETDDPENAVFPKVTIQQDIVTSVVEIDHAMTDQDEWQEGTVYHYAAGNQYYWVDVNGTKQTQSTNTSGIETTGIVITNTYADDNQISHRVTTKVKNNTKGEIVILDGANKVISSSRTTRIFDEDFYGSFDDSFVHWNWLPLYKGKNEIKVIGNCTVKIEYRYPIKCGEY